MTLTRRLPFWILALLVVLGAHVGLYLIAHLKPKLTPMEPPPAATVLIAIIGARMRTPATSVSNARSKAPA